MGDKNKTVLVIVVCLLSVALIWFLLWKLKKAKQTNDEGTSKETAKILTLGDRGTNVQELQRYLNTQLTKLSNGEIQYSMISEDGIFGEETAAACKVVFGTEYYEGTAF